MKSGPVTGDHTLTVIGENPRGVRKPVGSFPVALRGKDHGVNLIINLGLGVENDGLYWFDVVFDDEVLTRVPLMVTAAPKSENEQQAKT